MKPRSINIFLLDGDPDGIRVAQIMMSTIQAIAFRRNKLGEVRTPFPEIERPGVYILIGVDESEPDWQLAYICASEGDGARQSCHTSNEMGASEFAMDQLGNKVRKQSPSAGELRDQSRCVRVSRVMTEDFRDGAT